MSFYCIQAGDASLASVPVKFCGDPPAFVNICFVFEVDRCFLFFFVINWLFYFGEFA